jgi:hypothetical protein
MVILSPILSLKDVARVSQDNLRIPSGYEPEGTQTLSAEAISTFGAFVAILTR